MISSVSFSGRNYQTWRRYMQNLTYLATFYTSDKNTFWALWNNIEENVQNVKFLLALSLTSLAHYNYLLTIGPL